jgi:hypothetical protein
MGTPLRREWRPRHPPDGHGVAFVVPGHGASPTGAGLLFVDGHLRSVGLHPVHQLAVSVVDEDRHQPGSSGGVSIPTMIARSRTSLVRSLGRSLLMFARTSPTAKIHGSLVS